MLGFSLTGPIKKWLPKMRGEMFLLELYCQFLFIEDYGTQYYGIFHILLNIFRRSDAEDI